MDLTEFIKCTGLDLGFDLVGVTDAAPMSAEQSAYLADWLKKGRNGRMKYMERNFEKRTNPANLLRNARSVICVAINYKPLPIPPPPPKAPPAGSSANYALYEDYHNFIKNRLRKLVDLMAGYLGRSFVFKVCVDSAPLAERSFARRAGLGFIGRNHMLINPAVGPYLLLGEVVTDIPLKADTPSQQTCTGCNKCILACPTAALAADGGFDANRCISYLTIEHKSRIPPALRTKVGCRLYGCDECVLACPYQTSAPACANKQFKFFPERKWLNLQQILTWDRKTFTERLRDSPILRTGLDKLKQNAATCVENTNRQAQGARNISSSDAGISHPV
jgi:epoxyqueuosine reductase